MSDPTGCFILVVDDESRLTLDIEGLHSEGASVQTGTAWRTDGPGWAARDLSAASGTTAASDGKGTAPQGAKRVGRATHRLM